VGRYIPTPAFFTFDPIIRSPEILLPAISLSKKGEHGELIELVGGDGVGLDFTEGKGIELDIGTILFLCTAQWQDGNGAPRPLGSAHSRERLGRFPSEDGNAIEYLLNFVVVHEGSELQAMLEKISRRFDLMLNERGMVNDGADGMRVLGWIDREEVISLRMEIESGKWSVGSEETFDGGVQDAFRHLLVFLRSAGRRRCGMMMRGHR